MILAVLFAATPAHAGVLINEVMYAVTGTDDGHEWIELCNSGGSAVDLTNFTIETAGSSWGPSYVFPSGSIGPGEHLLVGPKPATWIATFSPALQNGGSATDGVRLTDAGGHVIDTVLYDEPNENGILDDEDNAGTGPVAGDDSSIGRWPDCVDSDNSLVDFHTYDTPSPGGENPDPGGDTGDTGDSGDTGDTGTGEADCSAHADVHLNEMVFTSDQEWIELYNSGSGPAAVGDWVLQFGSSSYSDSVTIPSGTEIPAGGHFVIGSPGATVTKDWEVGVNFGNATSSPASVQLMCGDAPLDTIIYGDDGDTNSAGWLEDSGVVASAYAPMPGDGQSIARVSDGYDTDVCAVDFAISDPPTPGATNTVIEPPVCNPDPTNSVKLNEFLVNPSSTDDGREWVELYNSGAADLRLDGWVIQTATSSWSDAFAFPSGTTIPAGGFFLLAGSAITNADINDDTWSLPNGTGGDGLRLTDCEGTVVDTVLYGETMTDGLVGDDGTADVVDAGDEDVSVGRYPDGVDTNASADWHPYAVPTPGAPNTDPEASGGGTGDTTGGCGGTTKPGTENPGGTCVTAPVSASPFVLLAALALARRRVAVRPVRG